MGKRTISYTLLGVVVASALIVVATQSQAARAGAHNWLTVQRLEPALWIADFLALGSVLLMAALGVAGDRGARVASEFLRIRAEYSGQLAEVIARSQQMEALNSAHLERIADLEGSALKQKASADEELRRLSEQAFLAVKDQVAANSRQLEAVNIAMRYQRSELRAARQELYSLPKARGSVRLSGLTPAELAAIQGACAVRQPEGTPNEDAEIVAELLAYTANSPSTVIEMTQCYEAEPNLILVDGRRPLAEEDRQAPEPMTSALQLEATSDGLEIDASDENGPITWHLQGRTGA